MDIQGFIPPAAKAIEEGTTFTYQTPYGEIRIVATIAGDENPGFSTAMMAWTDKTERAKSAGALDQKKAMRDLAMVFAKHVVLKWETSIKQGNGKAIEPTNDAFCDLMTHQARELRFVFNQFRDDVADLANFRDQRDEEAEKN